MLYRSSTKKRGEKYLRRRFLHAPFCCAVFLPDSQENKYTPPLWVSPKPWRFSLPTKTGKPSPMKTATMFTNMLKYRKRKKAFSESFSAVLRITKTTPKAPTIHTPKTAAKAKRCRTKPRAPFIRPEIRVREPSAAMRGAAKPKRTLQIILRRHRRG